MQINVKMPDCFFNYAKELRERFFGPNATVKEYRDSFVFSQAIDSFDAPPSLLIDYINTEQDLNHQRMVTIRVNTYHKLESLSKTLNCTIASVYRAIINYTVTSVESSNISYSDLELKVALLEKQLSDCQETLMQIKESIPKQKKLI